MKTIFMAMMMVLIFAVSATASTVILGWDASTDASVTNQKVYYGNTNTQPFNGTGAFQGVSGFLVPKGTSATVSGLDPTKIYYFCVTNFNATQNMESSCSNVVIVPPFPAPPQGLKATSVSLD